MDLVFPFFSRKLIVLKNKLGLGFDREWKRWVMEVDFQSLSREVLLAL